MTEQQRDLRQLDALREQHAGAGVPKVVKRWRGSLSPLGTPPPTPLLRSTIHPEPVSSMGAHSVSAQASRVIRRLAALASFSAVCRS